jgi:hypothetical protein
MNINFLKMYIQELRSKLRPSKKIQFVRLLMPLPHNAHLFSIPLFDANYIKELYIVYPNDKFLQYIRCQDYLVYDCLIDHWKEGL